MKQAGADLSGNVRAHRDERMLEADLPAVVDRVAVVRDRFGPQAGGDGAKAGQLPGRPAFRESQTPGQSTTFADDLDDDRCRGGDHPE
jgi:hypothetical protein